MKFKNVLNAIIILSGLSGYVLAHGGHNDAFAEKSSSASNSMKIKLSPEGKRAIGIKTETVKKDFLNKYIDATGQVSVANDNHANVSLAVSGLVKQVLVQEGDKVNRGDILAVIQSLEATQALKELLRQKTNIEKQILIMNSELELKKASYLREKTLVEEGISPKKDLLEATNAYEAASASLMASKSELASMLLTTRAELDIMRLPQAVIDRALNAGIIESNININIRAPISGMISARNINPGEALNSSDVIFVVDNIKPIWINVDIYQEQIPSVKLGQLVRISSSAGEELEAKIANISNLVNTDTRTLAVRVVSANDSGSLKPGMMVNAKILFDKSKEKSIVIPNNAVITKGEKSFVYLEHDDYYQSSELKLGFQDSSGIEVLEGLVEGDLIVVQGGEQIYSESLLKKGSSSHHDHGAKKSTNKIPWSILISVLISSLLTSAFWFFKRKGNK